MCEGQRNVRDDFLRLHTILELPVKSHTDGGQKKDHIPAVHSVSRANPRAHHQLPFDEPLYFYILTDLPNKQFIQAWRDALTPGTCG